jgi:hypothetical protein
VCVCVRATVEDGECEREPASYSELGNAFSERSDCVFWDNILTISLLIHTVVADKARGEKYDKNKLIEKCNFD